MARAAGLLIAAALALAPACAVAAPAEEPPQTWVREVLDWNVSAMVEGEEGCRVFFADLDHDKVDELFVTYPVPDRKISRVHVSRWKGGQVQPVFELESETPTADVGMVNGAPGIVVERFRSRDAKGARIPKEELHVWDGYRFSHNSLLDCDKSAMVSTHCVSGWNPMPSRPCSEFPR